MAAWVDVTSRLVTPVYAQTPSCPSEESFGLWDGWSGVSSSTGKPLVLDAGVWTLPSDGRLEVACPDEENCGAGPIGRLCGVLFDEPITAQALRIRYRITTAMVDAMWPPLDGRFDPGVLLSTGIQSWGLGGISFPAAQITDEDQTLEDDGLLGPEYAGVFLLLGASYQTECGYASHSGRTEPAAEYQLPFWIPPLQVWALMDAPSQFWRDLVGCREVSG